MSPLNQNDFIEKFKDVPNLLIGNGFTLSHPVLGSKFKWDKKAAFENSWESLLQIESEGSPERDLQMIRKKILRLILEFYIKQLF